MKEWILIFNLNPSPPNSIKDVKKSPPIPPETHPPLCNYLNSPSSIPPPFPFFFLLFLTPPFTPIKEDESLFEILCPEVSRRR